jgi:hypothetical protein
MLDTGYRDNRPKYARTNNIESRLASLKKANISVRRPVLNLDSVR